MNKIQHTPTPWEVEGNVVSVYGRGVIASCPSPTTEDGVFEFVNNARFIVTACNNHNKLVEACKEALEFMIALDVQRKVISGLSLQLNDVLSQLEKDGE